MVTAVTVVAVYVANLTLGAWASLRERDSVWAWGAFGWACAVLWAAIALF